MVYYYIGERLKLEGETERALVRRSGRQGERRWLRETMVFTQSTAMGLYDERKVGFMARDFFENTARRHRRVGRSEVTVTSEPHT